MTGAVEPIQRIAQPAAEQRLDLDRLARLKETKEPTERLHIPATRGLRDPPLHQRGDHPVDVVVGDLPSRLIGQREEPLQHAGAVIDRDLREPLRDLRAHERVNALLLEDPRIRHGAGRPVVASAHGLRSDLPARSLHHSQPSPSQTRTPPRRLKEEGSASQTLPTP
ncbi:MAG: hypothetical protein WBP81_36230 [Solirubrobacteraceae bacterium]